MSIDSIIERLKYNNGTFPREALAEAITNKDEITPRLLEILEDAVKNPSRLVREEGYFGHLYAMFLLAQFREKRAYEPLIQFFSNPDEEVLDTVGDVLTEDLARILASVCGGDTSLIKKLAEDENAYEFSRSAALDALVCLVVNDITSREEVLEYFRSLFHKLERKPSPIWGSLIASCTDLYPEEVYEEIKQAFADDLEQSWIIDLKFVDSRLALGKEKVLEKIRKDRHNHLVEDVIKEIEWWACFQPDEHVPYKRDEPSEFLLHDSLLEGTYIAPVKVGRNDPCPCGSGLKFKKCCGS